jgi:hypothetical protein
MWPLLTLQVNTHNWIYPGIIFSIGNAVAGINKSFAAVLVLYEKDIFRYIYRVYKTKPHVPGGG